jgi:hypothetical protein
MPLQDPLDGRRGDIDLVIPLQEEADPEGPVLPLQADLQDQGDDVGGRREGVVAAPAAASFRIPMICSSVNRQRRMAGSSPRVA